ncbi:MAG: 50S ribosomal protein L19e [Candidatus Aenigmatarchaeota archaeon]
MPQKKIAARILKCGVSRIWFDPSRISDILQAITAADIRKLINDGVIKKKPKTGVSNYRKKIAMKQKKKGRRKGTGTRKGHASGTRKMLWVKRIRVLRKTLKGLHDSNKIDKKTYRKLYMTSKSGFFRSRNHLLTYIEKNNLLKK